MSEFLFVCPSSDHWLKKYATDNAAKMDMAGESADGTEQALLCGSGDAKKLVMRMSKR